MRFGSIFGTNTWKLVARRWVTVRSGMQQPRKTRVWFPTPQAERRAGVAAAETERLDARRLEDAAALAAATDKVAEVAQFGAMA